MCCEVDMAYWYCILMYFEVNEGQGKLADPTSYLQVASYRACNYMYR